MLLQVEVPAGLGPGDEMSVDYEEQRFTVVVPDGVSAGMMLELDLPVADPAPVAAAATERVQVTVPDGLVFGDNFVVQATWGGEFTVPVPEGCHGGSIIEVELPLPEPSPAAEPPPQPLAPESASPSPPAAPGRRRRPNRRDSDTDGGMVEGSASRRGDRDSAAPARDSVEASAESEHAADPDDCFLYKKGQRVEVYRSDGSFSDGTIVYGFEGPFQACYKVEMDSGLFKEAVPEDEIGTAAGDVGDLFAGC